VVSGGTMPGASLIVTFGGGLAGKNLPAFKKLSSALTGGTSPAIAVVVTTKGGFTQFPKRPFARHEVKAYYASSLAGLDTAEAGNTHMGQFQHAVNFGGIKSWYWTENGSLSPTDIAEGTTSNETLQLVLKTGTILADLRAKNISKVTFYVRLVYLSKSYNIASTGTKEKITIDMAVQVATVSDYGGKGDNSKVYGASVMLQMVKDPNWGDKAFQIRGLNGKSDYTS
jgi:hypothetical protein